MIRLIHKRSLSWMKLLNPFLRQAGIQYPYFFWDFVRFLQQNLPQDSLDINKNKSISLMSWREFEQLICLIFEKKGYLVCKSKLTRDWGADMVLQRDNECIVVQVKMRSKKVGVTSVQQTHSARDFYNAHKAILVTNSTFTSPAIQLSNRLHIELWDGKKLFEEMNTLRNNHIVDDRDDDQTILV